MKKLILSFITLLSMAGSAFAQIGSLSSDLVFTPITPCRIVDTRNAGGAIVGGSPSAPNPRVFKGWAPNYTAQGGSATNCGLPQTSNIAALSVNLVVVGTAGDGWIAAYPVGAALPVVSNLNYLAGAVLANSAILKINQTTNDWNLFSTQNTHFVADVTGYYSKPVSIGSLECVTTTPVTTDINLGPLNGVYYAFALASSCTTGYTEVALYCEVSGATASASPLNSGGYCGGNVGTASGYTVSASRRCCRIPGR